MVKEKPATPEKDLLRLIEEPDKEKKARPAQAIKHQGLSLFSFSAWLGRISFFKKRLKKAQFKKQGLYLIEIKSLNRVLLLIIFILVFYFAGDLFFSISSFKKPQDSELKLEREVQSAALEDTSFLKRAVSYYLEQVSKRNIFQMGRDPVTGVSKKITSITLSEKLQSLKLVGISWSDNPDAMIEDKKAMRTFFVKRGQMVGELRVEAIFKDKVILSYGDEEIELQ